MGHTFRLALSLLLLLFMTGKTLNLSVNGLIVLPEVICLDPRLTELDLGYNALSELPAAFCRLRLVRVGLSHNHFSHFPEVLLTQCTLTQLSLRGNELSGLPATLAQALPHLQALNLADNTLQRLPAMENMTRLMYLNVSENELRELPFLPASLMELRVDDNELTQLPAHLGRLANLTRLSAMNCPLEPHTGVPSALGACTSLLVLDLPPTWAHYDPCRACERYFWTLSDHGYVVGRAGDMFMRTALLCGVRCVPDCPCELWLHIFEFLAPVDWRLPEEWLGGFGPQASDRV